MLMLLGHTKTQCRKSQLNPKSGNIICIDLDLCCRAFFDVSFSPSNNDGCQPKSTSVSFLYNILVACLCALWWMKLARICHFFFDFCCRFRAIRMKFSNGNLLENRFPYTYDIDKIDWNGSDSNIYSWTMTWINIFDMTCTIDRKKNYKNKIIAFPNKYWNRSIFHFDNFNEVRSIRVVIIKPLETKFKFLIRYVSFKTRGMPTQRNSCFNSILLVIRL